MNRSVVSALAMALTITFASTMSACGTYAAPENPPPVAEAGLDLHVSIGSTITFDSSLSSDPDGPNLTYHWRIDPIPKGSNAHLSDPTATTPTFTIDVAGSYVVTLIVNDGIDDSNADSFTIETPIVTGIDLNSLRELALTPPFYVQSSTLHLIDNRMLLWQWQGDCCDFGYGVSLYGPDGVICSCTDSIAGPRYTYNNTAYAEMFDTILAHAGEPDLGLGAAHTVEAISF